MEALLIIGALAAGAHYMNQDEPTVEQTAQVQNLPQTTEFIFNEGLENLDWSRAGNFTVTSTSTQVKWVMITGN